MSRKGGKRSSPNPRPKRRRSCARRELHDDELGPLQVLDQPLRHDLGHDLVGVVNPLATLVAQCEGERRSEVGRVGGRELVGVGHQRTIAEGHERSKNMRRAIVFAVMLLSNVWYPCGDVANGQKAGSLAPEGNSEPLLHSANR